MKRPATYEKRPVIVYGFAPSPFGRCLVALKNGFVCALSFGNTTAFRESWPNADIRRDDAFVAPYLKRIFGRNGGRPVPVAPEGTEFQLKVWKALIEIPRGRTANYADVARAIGSPKAVRAVGTACGKNRIGFLIPCHRVLASHGGLGGYRWGAKRKKAMLEWETVRK